MNSSHSSPLMKLSRLFIALIIIAAGVVMLFYFYRHFYTLPIRPPSNEIANIIVTQPILIKTDEQGRKIIQFSSDILWYYQKYNRSEFTKPVGYYYPQNAPPWQVRADQGEAIEGDSVVYLQGNVWLHQEAGQHNHELTVTTEQMTIYPKEKTAQNSVFVKIEEPGLIVTSIGFFADLKQHKLKLLSQTKGYYNPQKIKDKL